jgi:hypothetical protein
METAATCPLTADSANLAERRHVTCTQSATMKNVIDNLVALQELQLKTPKSTPNRAEQMEALRSEIPEPLLRIFDRFVARKRKSVAVVRNGVCGECHLKIAVGILGSLAFGQGVQQCGNCGRFLYLPEDETVYVPETLTKTKAGRPRKKPVGASRLAL